MVKVMHNDQLAYKVVIWASFRISSWKEKVALNGAVLRKRKLCTYSAEQGLGSGKIKHLNWGYENNCKWGT